MNDTSLKDGKSMFTKYTSVFMIYNVCCPRLSEGVDLRNWFRKKRRTYTGRSRTLPLNLLSKLATGAMV
jgi:hypothetical protein